MIASMLFLLAFCQGLVCLWTPDVAAESLALAVPFRWVVDAWGWFTNPSVMPWAGATAAVASAFSIQMKQWLRRPKRAVYKAAQVAVVWLIVAFLLSVVSTGSAGSMGDRDSVSGDPADKVAIDEVAVAQFPLGFAAIPGAEAVLQLTIEFIPSPANPDTTIPFACKILVPQTAGTEQQQIEIQASNMSDFEEAIMKQFREMDPQSMPSPLTVRIRQQPFPGEPMIRNLRTLVRNAFGECEIILGER